MLSCSCVILISTISNVDETCMTSSSNLSIPSSYYIRYPYEEAATIAISTVKEFANDFKEVSRVSFSLND